MNSLKSRTSPYLLSFAVDHFLQTYRPPEHEKAAGEVAMEYLEKRTRDCIRSFISQLQLKAIKSEMNWFKIKFGDKPVSSISLETLREYLENPKNHPRCRRQAPEATSAKTWNNRAACFTPLPSTAWRRTIWRRTSWRSFRSIKSTTPAPPSGPSLPPRSRDSCISLKTTPAPITAVQPKGFLVLVFALALFTGVRSDWKDGEIRKLQPYGQAPWADE